MRVLRGDPSTWNPEGERRAVAIGVFDGLHLGHRSVLADLARRASAQHLTPAVLTFDPHPLAVISPEHAPLLLTTLGQRLERFADAGVDLVAVVEFDDEIRWLSPADFVTTVLVDGLGAGLVMVGTDFRFGRDRQGDAEALVALGREHGFDTEIVSLVGDGEPVSSSHIRRLVASGDVVSAAQLLTRPHEVIGTVVAGEGRGRTIGVPTANVAVPPGVALPAHGVYAVTASSDGDQWLHGVANLGVRPTFDGANETLEVHLLDTETDLYGAELRVRFIDRIRDEQRFADVDSLVAQIAADIATARRIHAG